MIEPHCIHCNKILEQHLFNKHNYILTLFVLLFHGPVIVVDTLVCLTCKEMLIISTQKFEFGDSFRPGRFEENQLYRQPEIFIISF